MWDEKYNLSDTPVHYLQDIVNQYIGYDVSFLSPYVRDDQLVRLIDNNQNMYLVPFGEIRERWITDGEQLQIVMGQGNYYRLRRDLDDYPNQFHTIHGTLYGVLGSPPLIHIMHTQEYITEQDGLLEIVEDDYNNDYDKFFNSEEWHEYEYAWHFNEQYINEPIRFFLDMDNNEDDIMFGANIDDYF